MKNQKSTPLTLIENYGLHAPLFGAIPTLADYEQFLLLHAQKEIALFTVDIKQELALLEDPLCMLCICVPTLGFTDPALDYMLSPCFALPLSIDGVHAKDPQAIQANLFGTDLAGNDYPLLANAQGKIDFALIEKKLNDKKNRFTTLHEITFGFTQSHLNNNDLIRSDKKGLLELAIPSWTDTFEFQMKVVKENKVLSNRVITYTAVKENAPLGKLMTLWQEGRQKSYLHINYKLTPLKQVGRAKIVIDIPMQEDVNYTWESAPCVKGFDSKSLRFTQFYGLSVDAFKQVICAVISPMMFVTGFMSSESNKSSADSFNRYDIHPQLKLCLYEHVINGVLNQSVPLFALSPYFASFDEVKANLLNINWASFDDHDQFVFKKLYEILLTEECNVMPLIEEVDRLLSLHPEYCETTLVLETMGKALKENALPIKAHFSFEDKNGELLYAIGHEAKIQILRKNRSMTLVENQAPPVQKGAVYNLNLNHIVKGAHVIEGFNWQANDKINLSDLMDALTTCGGSSVVHAKITPLGDTEIWVEHHSNEHKTEQYHIATLKGLNHLPGDISHFIEVGHNG